MVVFTFFFIYSLFPPELLQDPDEPLGLSHDPLTPRRSHAALPLAAARLSAADGAHPTTEGKPAELAAVIRHHVPAEPQSHNTNLHVCPQATRL